jgi:Siphovirus Gp157
MLLVEYWIERTAKMLEQKVNTLRLHIEALLRDYPMLADDEILRADTLDGATDIGEIVTEVHRLIEDAKALRDGTQARMDDLIARRTRFQQRVDFGRDLILKIMESADIRKIELPEVTAYLKANPQQLIGDVDPNTLPDQYVKITRTVDRRAVREAFAHGEIIGGFQMSNAPPSLTLKVK